MSTRSARSTSSSLSPAPSLSQPPTHNPPKVTTSSQPTFGSSWTTTTLSLQGTAAAALKSKINLLLHDSKSEFDWNAILLAIAPQPGPIHEVVSFGQVPNVRILTNEDLLALSVEGETRSRLHDGIQQALAEAKAAEVAASSSRRDPPARRSASSSTRSTPPRLSASSSTPSTPARTLHVGPRTGMRFPDLSLRVQTFVRILNARMLFEASGVEGEVKVYKHGPIRKPCALPEHGDDEDRQVPADAINHSLHDQWLRGLSKAVVYLTIAFEIAGTRLGLSVVSELLQRLAVVADVGEERTAVAIEVGTVPEEQPGTFAAFLRTSAGQEHNFPWRFGYVNFEAPGGPVVELDWAGIEAYRDVFNAGFAMFRDVRVDAPIQRFSDLAVDASPLVNNILSRCAEFQTWEELRRLEVSAFARPQLEPHYRAAAEKAGESIPDDVFHRPKGSRAPSSAFTRRSSTGSAPRSSPSSPSAARRRRSVPVTPPRQPVFRSPKPSPGGGGGGVGAGSGYRRSPRFSTSGGAGGGGGVGAANGGGEEGKSGGTAGAGDCDNATLRFACPRSFSTTLEEDGGEVSFVSSVSSTTRSADAPSLEEDGPDSFWEEHIVSDEDENWDGDDWVKDSDDSDTESDPGRAARSAIDKFLDALTLEQLIHLFERIPPIPIVLVPREEMGEVIHGTAGW